MSSDIEAVTCSSGRSGIQCRMIQNKRIGLFKRKELISKDEISESDILSVKDYDIVQCWQGMKHVPRYPVTVATRDKSVTVMTE
jgi:hypothetical protein